MTKYQLRIPFDNSLDSLAISEVANALEEHGVRVSVESLNWPSLFPYRPLTVITAAHSEEFVYIDFFVRCNYLRAENYANNTPVSEDSCVEFYVEPMNGCNGYFCFELNCIGAINAYKRLPDGTDEKLPERELAEIKRFASVGPRPFCEVEGSFTWNVVLGVPLKILGLRYEQGKHIELKGNFNKCASATSQPHYLSWSPINSDTPDFHQPSSFGMIVLE